MTRRTPRKDPRLIRAALDYWETHGVIETAERFNTDPHNLYRWRRYRAEVGPQWPTDADIAHWDTVAPTRARRAARRHQTEVRMYLNQGPYLRDATGTIRRLQALGALGHSQEAIGAELGLTSERVSQLARGLSRSVFPRTAETVDDLYRRWCMVVPAGRSATAARTYASRKGWPPPLAWDDEAIDDPKARPQGLEKATFRHRGDLDEVVVLRAMAGERLTLTKAERTAVVCRLRADRWSDRRIEMHTGIKADRYKQPAETSTEVAA